MKRLSPKRYDKIQEHVTRVLFSYVFLSFPFDIKSYIRIVPKLELKYYREYDYPLLLQKKSNDGFGFMRPDGIYVIVINDAQPIERQRFTIAHELGHFVLGHFSKKDLDEETKEAEANFFAARLLAPNWAINRLKSKDVWSISTAFGISAESAVYRYHNYNNWFTYGQPMTELESQMSEYCFFKEVELGMYVE